MTKKTITTFLAVFIAIIGFAQQIPLGSCGIINHYDAAGNRIKRFYYCYNGGPYQGRAINKNELTKADETTEFQNVDALYPNPTTGKFSVTFSKELKNAIVYLTDLQGKVILQFKASGSKVDFDISGVAAGAYFVRIEDNGKVITKKVIKQ
jgi:Secretion system C-terminal sorting domain